VFSDPLVDHGAMRVAQRHVGRLRSKAFPDRLHQAQPFLGRELGDFGNTGIAHEAKPTTVTLSALTLRLRRAGAPRRVCPQQVHCPASPESAPL
jgi:hypothetical protein